MEKIKFNDINFDSLQKLKQQGTKGIMYKNGVTCYKILDGLYEDEKEEIYKKFIDLDGIKIENVLLPKELIMKDGKLYGYTMDYFNNSVSLSDKFCVRSDCGIVSRIPSAICSAIEITVERRVVWSVNCSSMPAILTIPVI